MPADRFFGVASEVSRALKARAAANAFQLARDGVPRKPFYLTGQAGGKSFSVHAEGDRVFLTREGEAREEVDLTGETAPGRVPAALVTEVKTRFQAWQEGEEGGGSNASPLPLPLVPQGVVTADAAQLDEDLDDRLPGESPLDEGLDDLRAALTAAEEEEN